ncbi:MAG: hypothetical protein ACOY0T_09350 [Myxococcota bacterium]
MSKRGIVAALLVGGLFAGTVTYFTVTTRQQAANMRELEARLRSLNEQVAAGAEREDVRVRTLAQAVQAAQVIERPPALPREAAAAQAPVTSEATNPPPSYREQFAYLEAELSSQSTDVAWARSSSTKLQEGLGRIAKDARGLETVECRSTLCRARYTDSAVENCEDFLRQATHPTPPYFWEGAYLAVRDEPQAGGRCGVRLMFAREQTEMPLLE